MQVTKVTKVTLFSRKYSWKANQLKSKSQIVSPSNRHCHFVTPQNLYLEARR